MKLEKLNVAYFDSNIKHREQKRQDASSVQTLGSYKFPTSGFYSNILFKGLNTSAQVLGSDEFLKKTKIARVDEQNISENFKNENLIGTGATSEVFKFSHPALKGWVVKVDRGHKGSDGLKKSMFKETADEFPSMNMGQEIVRLAQGNDSHGYHILKRINGVEHSIGNWSTFRREKNEITEPIAKEFASSLDKIASFPQESFDEYAQKLKLLDEKGYKADSFNPNNYLIDYDNKKIHIIDTYKYYVDANMNTQYDIICPLLDYPNFDRHYSALNASNRGKFLESSRQIIEKCENAARKVGLRDDAAIFKEFISRVDKREGNGGMYSKAFSTLSEILPVYDENLALNGDSLSYGNFLNALKVAEHENPKEIQNSMNEKNRLGEGENSLVYNFNNPILDGWVIKVDKKSKDPEAYERKYPFRKSKDEFEGLNLGQEIANASGGVHILKKIKGEQLSVDAWDNCLNSLRPVSKAETTLFVDNIAKISQFSDAAFLDYANQLEILTSKGYKMDSLNPNNLLVDYENEKINIIDFYKGNQPAHKNSKYDLTMGMLDFCLLDRFLAQMTPEQKKTFAESARAIVEKVENVSSQSQFFQSEDTFYDFLGFVDKCYPDETKRLGKTKVELYDNLKNVIEEN